MRFMSKLLFAVGLVLVYTAAVHADTILVRGTYVYNDKEDQIVVSVKSSNFNVDDGIIVVNNDELKSNGQDGTKTWSMISDQKPGLVGKTWEYTDAETNLTSTISLIFDKDTGIKNGGAAFIMITEEVMVSENTPRLSEKVVQ